MKMTPQERSQMEREMFQGIFDYFKEYYTYQDLKVIDDCVYTKGRCRFNTKEYNLLYNLTRLCNALKEELR